MMAEIVDTFPHATDEIEFERIPLSDGVHLSCRYWLPKDAGRNPVPAMLVAIDKILFTLVYNSRRRFEEEEVRVVF